MTIFTWLISWFPESWICAALKFFPTQICPNHNIPGMALWTFLISDFKERFTSSSVSKREQDFRLLRILGTWWSGFTGMEERDIWKRWKLLINWNAANKKIQQRWSSGISSLGDEFNILKGPGLLNGLLQVRQPAHKCFPCRTWRNSQELFPEIRIAMERIFHLKAIHYQSSIAGTRWKENLLLKIQEIYQFPIG